MTWTAKRLHGSASTLHEFSPPERPERTLCAVEAHSTAFVIGSAQRESEVDSQCASALGVSIVRRGSGGGAVLLVPGRHVWIDVWLPSGDALWSDDVIVAADWLGEAFALALTDAQVQSVSVHRGPASSDAWSKMVCFLGRGPGEVFSGGQKIVGLSQRRTRDWIRFQTVVHRQFSARLTADLLAVAVDSEAVAQWQSQVYEIGDLPILDLLRARLPR
ncbi:MAG: hypothetical protein OXF75_01650 [Acidimicrobiaceae bacterium]|nr:hypothetical protein [Acidimicrobiaceae bacterium]